MGRAISSARLAPLLPTRRDDQTAGVEYDRHLNSDSWAVRMAQNIYDDPTFFAGYSQLPRQVHGLDAAPEWPALRTMLPDLTGKRVVDLGCGFGWFARWAREHGAASVLGWIYPTI